MELLEFARHILLSERLEEKLAAPDKFTDLHSNVALDFPSIPARCERLSLSRWKTSAKVAFPSQHDLLDPTQVGVLLHFFANHELLALELMALALLKFPDAPRAFRMGIVRTMLDEQKHLRSYLRRMGDLGVEFGDIPLNDFFWSQCASMATPMDYVCRMSLTFEQANLDFAAFFKDVLVNVGDNQTASLMDEVLSDEMNHVSHGLSWFKKWKRVGDSEWQTFCAALGAEINPARAKGTIFRDDIRKSLGFSEDFIDSLRVFSQSKGRPPRFVYFNPDAEEEVRAGGLTHFSLNAGLLDACDDLSPVMLFVAAQTDLVGIARELPKKFLVNLSQCGFLLPEFTQYRHGRESAVQRFGTRRLSGVLPWSASPSSVRLAQQLCPADPGIFAGSNEELKAVHSKVTAFELLREYIRTNAVESFLPVESELGAVIRSREDFDSYFLILRDGGEYSRFVAKRPWSASGRHRFFGSISHGVWDEQPEELRSWFKKSWRMGEFPLMQPYFERVVDLSLQCRIDGCDVQEKVMVLGMTRVLNTMRGQYAGTCVGRFLSDCEGTLLRFFHEKRLMRSGESGNLEDVMGHLGRWVGGRLRKMGLRGAFGIDCFVYRLGDGRLKLFPMIEINPRHTMGRVALSMSRRMVPGRIGVWLHIPQSWLEKLQVSSFEELARRWEQLLPLRVHSSGRGTVIASGLLQTTPAENCQRVWTCFAVLENFTSGLAALGVGELLGVSTSDLKTDKPELRL